MPDTTNFQSKERGVAADPMLDLTNLVTDEDVLALHLKTADAETLAKVADARRRDDEELTRIEAKYGLSPDLDAPDDTAYSTVPSGISRFVRERWEEDEWIDADFAQNSALETVNPIPPMPVGDEPCRRLGIWILRADVRALAGEVGRDATEHKPPCVSLVRRGNDIEIYVAQHKASVPYGLVRVTAKQHGFTIASGMWTLRFDEDKELWTGRIPLRQLFEGDPPAKDIHYYVQPACRRLFRNFSVIAVQDELRELKSYQTYERQCLENLLADLKAEGNHVG